MSRSVIALPLLVLLCACSEAPKTAPDAKKKEPAKPAEPVSGRYALYQMYTAARGWAPDATPLALRSIHITQVKSIPGRTGAWQATFVSASRSRARSYTYSVVQSEGNLYKGVFAGLEENYSGPRGQSKPFLIAAIKTDSDEVYKTALKKSEDYEKKFPGKPISFLLELTSRFPNPAWRVIWGESVGTSNYSVFVDASTGEFLQKMR